MPGLLRMRVSDDGCGGARVEARGGLAGLAERIRTVDGRLRLTEQRPFVTGVNGTLMACDLGC